MLFNAKTLNGQENLGTHCVTDNNIMKMEDVVSLLGLDAIKHSCVDVVWTN